MAVNCLPYTGIDTKVTVRLFPEPPQTAVGAGMQRANVTEPGKLSVTVTLVAGSGPLLLTPIA
jgi:hypothetical protein